MRRHGAPARSRGIALITAVFVVALAAIAATALLSATGIALHRTENLRDSEAAWWYANGLEDWIAGLLKRRPGQPGVDSLGDPWAQPVSYLPYERGVVSGRLIDLQGRFNLNNLATSGADLAYYEKQFRLLLASVPGVDPSDGLQLAQAIHQWISPPATGYGDGGSIGLADTYYLSLDPPYRTAGRLLTSVGGLLAIQGMTPQLFEALKPYVTVLPEVSTRINVNTAPLPVLLSLALDVDASKLKEFTQTRIQHPMLKVEDLYATKYDLLPADVPSSRVDVATSYFQLRAHITVGSAKLDLYSDIHRPQGGTPVVYARSTGSE